MSWRRMYGSLQEMVEDITSANGEDIATGHQINEARRNAIALISSAVVGNPEDGDEDSPKKDFVIVLEGHANEEHFAQFTQDQKDWIRISITQK